ncbi:MAG TPA: beta-galactosidase trimerization domain-containing protein [bacterium]|nr:beta-galactosidase trimerization domain-containing protein [bacterium]
MGKSGRKNRRLFCDWHMPDFLPEIKLDAEYFVKKAVETGAESMTFMCKSAFGNCLYPSRAALSNKSIKADGDIFGKVCRLAKENGLEFIAYYSMLLDDALGEEHGDWLQVNYEGQKVKMEHYHMFCMNSPYRDMVFRHIEEIAGLFEIDGFMFDIQYFNSRSCFCKWCREKFSKKYGYELTLQNLGRVENMLDFFEFKKDCRRNFIMTAVNRAKKIRKNLVFTWNGGGADRKLDSCADFLGGEAHPPAYLECAVTAKLFQSLGKPFDLWMPESIGSWGHWSLTTSETLKGMSAIAVSHGGAIGINHVAPPCGDYAGRVFPGVYDTLGEVMKWVKEREPFCAGYKTIPVTAILMSDKSCRLEQFSLMLEKRIPLHFSSGRPDMKNIQSALQLLKENSIPVDILNTGIDPERIFEYEAVIIPDMVYIDRKTEKTVRRYVENGGRILATYTSSLYNAKAGLKANFGLADVFGADFHSFSDYSVIYIDSLHPSLKKGIPDLPMLVKDAGFQQNPYNKAIYCRVRENGAVLAEFTEPVIESDWKKGYHIYHDHAPAGKKTGNPAIILNKFGKGISVFMPFPILQANSFQPNPWYRHLVKSILGYMGVPQKIKIDAPVSVSVTATSKGRETLLHLINIQKETNSVFLDSSAISIPVKCSLKTGRKVNSVENAVTKKKIGFKEKEGRVSFTVPGIKTYEIIRIKCG